MTPENVRTASDLFDLAHEWFGIGAYDELAHPEPAWWQIRQAEAGKLNQLMKRRRVTLVELVRAAEFCRAQCIPVTNTHDLFKQITPSLVAARKAERAGVAQEVALSREDAAAEALEAGEQEWVDRIMRASQGDVEAVVAQWRSRDA